MNNHLKVFFFLFRLVQPDNIYCNNADDNTDNDDDDEDKKKIIIVKGKGKK